MTSGTTSCVVQSASLFPTNPQFRLLVDQEIMLVTAVSGTTFTVTRGIENTVAAAHANGANVYLIFTAGAMDQIRADISTRSTWANRFAAEKVGRFFLPSDGYDIERDNGTSWDAAGPLDPLTPPVAGNFSWRNQGTSTITQQGSGLFLSTPASATNNVAIQEINVPAKPYSVIAKIRPLLYLGGTQYCGLCFDDGTKLATFGYQWDTVATLPKITSDKWTNVTTFSANYTFVDARLFHWMQLMYLKIHDDSSNRICSVSPDGINFITIHSVATNDFLTPTKVGFFATTSDSGKAAGMLLESWQQLAS